MQLLQVNVSMTFDTNTIYASKEIMYTHHI